REHGRGTRYLELAAVDDAVLADPRDVGVIRDREREVRGPRTDRGDHGWTQRARIVGHRDSSRARRANPRARAVSIARVRRAVADGSPARLASSTPSASTPTLS